MEKYKNEIRSSSVGCNRLGIARHGIYHTILDDRRIFITSFDNKLVGGCIFAIGLPGESARRQVKGDCRGRKEEER